MQVMIIGAGGMLGRKLAARIAADGALEGKAVEALSLVDVFAPEAPAGFAGKASCQAADLSAPGVAAALVASRPEVIVHLAAIVSGEAEADFDKGYRINLDGTRLLFEAIRAEAAKAPYRPRVVFTSSIAVFGAPFPEVIDDEFFCLREPLVGQEAVLPVEESVRHWHASPRAAVGFLVRAASMDLAPLGNRRTLNLPGLSATVGEQIEALRRVAGERAVKLIRREPDPTIARIVAGWPENFTATRAKTLGFAAETTFDEIIRVHIEDELGGTLPG
ncbi:MAG: NAD-dependent epimerase [Acidiphilium sp. 21-68-69]|nr:MAG: NAD-dependent epimerase [Acidiphilium sp. 21-68-69]